MLKTTLLRIPNPDSRTEKQIIFQHEEGLGEFREMLRTALREKLIEQASKGAKVCWDELFAEVQSKFQRYQPCHWQILDLDFLLKPVKEEQSGRER